VSDLEWLAGLVETPGEWRDAVEEAPAVATAPSMALLADCLGGPMPHSDVPPMWLAATAGWPAAATLGVDGHPVTGLGYPPLPHRRRMFAGGNLRVLSPIAIGTPVTRRSRVTDVQAKPGRSGPLAFVTLTHDFLDGEVPTGCREAHQLVYRSGSATAAPTPPGHVPVTPPPDDPARSIRLATDPVTLFRFSALTANSHRIHYDAAYATGVEGLPGVIVHGPLLAMLQLELARRLAPDRRVASYAYRFRRPVVAGSELVASLVDEHPHHWLVAVRADGVVSVTGEIHFDADES
jgi:3-methylfumaryl-CoA hydratase